MNINKINKKNNTYKRKLSKIYAGQASKIHEKATFLYMCNFPVQLTKAVKKTDKTQKNRNRYSKTPSNRTGGGLITSTGVVLVVLVLVFVVPGAVLVVIDAVASHYGY